MLQFLRKMHKQSKKWSGVQYPLKELSEIYNRDSLSKEDIFLHFMCATEHDVLKSMFTFINSCFIARNCSNTSLVPVQ